MNAVKPKFVLGEQEVVFAANQPQYRSLPARISQGTEGVVTTEWDLDADEAATLLRGGRIRLQLMTFGKPLQPIKIEVIE